MPTDLAQELRDIVIGDGLNHSHEYQMEVMSDSAAHIDEQQDRIATQRDAITELSEDLAWMTAEVNRLIAVSRRG